MAIQYNDVTEIGDSFIIETNTPIIGIQAISSFTDVTNETIDRFFTKEFRYSTNGITFSEWMALTNDNLAAINLVDRDIFDLEYRYTRAGTDTVGLLNFTSISLQGVIADVGVPTSFTDLYFNKFFNYTDPPVLDWALNVLNKLYQRGIVAEYIDRQEPGIDDDDFLALFGALTHFMAIIVNYARVFENFNLNDLLLAEYLEQKGVFVSDTTTLLDLQNLLANLHRNFLERGTNQIVERAGEEGRLVDGELRRLISNRSTDEFIWGLVEREKTIWNINNNSPLYRGTKNAINLTKAYEFEQDVQLLSNYPLLNDQFILKFSDVTAVDNIDREVIEIRNANDAPNDIQSGIKDIAGSDSLIVVDPRLNYEITFYARHAVLGDYFTFGVEGYDSDRNLISGAFLKATDKTSSSLFFSKQRLLQDDRYYFIRGIIFNANRDSDANDILNIGFGNNLIFSTSSVNYISPAIVSDIANGDPQEFDNNLRIWDFKVRPLNENFPNGFVMVPNIISSFIQNNSEDNNRLVENYIRRYLIPYNVIFKNQFLDELVEIVPQPLTIQVSITDETLQDADNGSITIVGIGGTLPHEFRIRNTDSYVTGNVFGNLAPSTYDASVRDAEGAVATQQVTINEGLSSLDFTTISTDSTNQIADDGSIIIQVSGGLSPYFYSVDAGDNYQSDNTFTGLAPGTYDVTVRDTNGTIVTKQVVIGVSFNISAVNTSSLAGATMNIDELLGQAAQLIISAPGLNGGAPLTFTVVLEATPGPDSMQIRNTLVGADLANDLNLSSILSAAYTITGSGNSVFFTSKASGVNRKLTFSAVAGSGTEGANSPRIVGNSYIRGVVEIIGNGGVPPYEYQFQRETGALTGWDSDNSREYLSTATNPVIVSGRDSEFSTQSDTADLSGLGIVSDSFILRIGALVPPTGSLDVRSFVELSGPSEIGILTIEVEQESGAVLTNIIGFVQAVNTSSFDPVEIGSATITGTLELGLDDPVIRTRVVTITADTTTSTDLFF